MIRQSLMDHWTFDNGSGEAAWITLPHDAAQTAGRRKDAPSGSGGAFFNGGSYYYRKTFPASHKMREGTVFLELEGVMPHAEIELNGKPVGTCLYGYSGYRFRLEELQEDNELAVRVDDTEKPSSRWYAGSGIYRPVSLWVGGREYIEPNGIRVTTLDISPARIRVDVCAHLQEGAEIVCRICRDGNVTAEGEGATQVFDLPDADLWSAEHPSLYTCTAVILRGGKAVDKAECDFGIRKIDWNCNGFFINGERTLLRGGCIHHDNGILGARCYRESEYRRMARLKQAGFNAVRSAHNPAGRYLLEACDRLGMYVLDEGWDMWYKHKSACDYASDFESGFRDDIRSMTEKDYNHPSVVMYSIGNEVTEPAKEKGVNTGKELVRLFHAYDATRPVTAGINLTLLLMASAGIDLSGASADASGEKKEISSTDFNQSVSENADRMRKAAASPKADSVASPILDCLDIAGYNYADSRYEMDGRLHPDRIILGTESYPWALAKNWELVKRCPRVIGDFMWTAWDYLGETGIGAWSWKKEDASFDKKYPWLLAEAGVFDILGNSNAEAGLVSAVYKQDPGPYIAVRPVNHAGEELYKAMWRGSNGLPHWSYAGCDGNEAVVEIYSAGAEAELLINGRSLGRKKLTDKTAVFHTVYEPGCLTARIYDAFGKQLSEKSLHSAEGKLQVRIAPEKQYVPEEQIVYVDIDLVGENGEIECGRDQQLQVKVEGGELLAFGSARPKTEEDFLAGKYRTYYGRSLAVIKKTGNTRILVSGGNGMEAEANLG